MCLFSITWLFLYQIGCYEVTDTTGMKTIAKITYLGECQIKCKAVLPLLQNNQPSYFGYNVSIKTVLYSEIIYMKVNIVVVAEVNKVKLKDTEISIYPQ